MPGETFPRARPGDSISAELYNRVVSAIERLDRAATGDAFDGIFTGTGSVLTPKPRAGDTPATGFATGVSSDPKTPAAPDGTHYQPGRVGDVETWMRLPQYGMIGNATDWYAPAGSAGTAADKTARPLFFGGRGPDAISATLTAGGVAGDRVTARPPNAARDPLTSQYPPPTLSVRLARPQKAGDAVTCVRDGTGPNGPADLTPFRQTNYNDQPTAGADYANGIAFASGQYGRATGNAGAGDASSSLGITSTPNVQIGTITPGPSWGPGASLVLYVAIKSTITYPTGGLGVGDSIRIYDVGQADQFGSIAAANTEIVTVLAAGPLVDVSGVPPDGSGGYSGNYTQQVTVAAAGTYPKGVVGYLPTSFYSFRLAGGAQPWPQTWGGSKAILGAVTGGGDGAPFRPVTVATGALVAYPNPDNLFTLSIISLVINFTGGAFQYLVPIDVFVGGVVSSSDVTVAGNALASVVQSPITGPRTTFVPGGQQGIDADLVFTYRDLTTNGVPTGTVSTNTYYYRGGRYAGGPVTQRGLPAPAPPPVSGGSV